MFFRQRLEEHRSTVVFVILVACCLVSLFLDLPASKVGNPVRTAIAVVAYPFQKALSASQNAVTYLSNMILFHHATEVELEAVRKQHALLMVHAAERGELSIENEQLRGMLAFEREHPLYQLEAVDIIGRSEGTRQLIIDRGSSQGVEAGMCVISEDGLVGQVTEVFPYTANVSTLHSAACRVGAMIERNRVRGIVRGAGSDMRGICNLQFIDAKDEVLVGDKVVVSRESLFPSGLPIGRIRAVHEEPGLLFKSAEVAPAADPYRLEAIFLVRRTEPSVSELTDAKPSGNVVTTIPSPQEELAP